ncbi:MAG: hypothetical protein SV775_02985 [Thermodesulfobacteriota bacterium]|nr:hypothetical protein [Thermodesulfobacteriota bacterium]
MIKNLLLSFLTVIFCLLVGESVMRSVGPPYFDSLFWEYEPELGWTNRKDCFFYSTGGDKKPILVEFNKEGFRGNNYPAEKPAYTRRVIILGDSFSEATQVNVEEIYWRRLSTLLGSNNGNYRWEVINFGVGDYSTTQEYLTLVSKALDYSPDLIVLQVFPGNDVCNNTIVAPNIASPQDEYRPYFDPETQYRTITYLSPATSWFRRHFSLFRFIDIRIRHLASNVIGKPDPGSRDFWLAEVEEKLMELGLPRISFYDYQLYSAAASILSNTFAEPEYQFPFIREGWKVTDHAIRKIVSVAEDVGIPVIVLVFPSEIQFPPKYAICLNELPFPIDRYYPGRRIADLLRSYNVPVLTFIDRFEESLYEVTPFIDGHFNAAAHEIVANILAEVVGEVLPEAPYYQFGKTVSFDEQGAGRKFIAYGIAQPSAGTSWTIANKAGIHLRLPPTRTSLVMTLRAIPFAPEELGMSQFVEVYFNGGRIARWSLSGKHVKAYRGLVTPSLVAANDPAEILFEFSERRSPHELGISQDKRLLGLALVDIVIDQVSASKFSD